MRRILLLIIIPIATVVSVWGQNGPYAPPVGQSGTTAIHKDSSIISGWADSCSVIRGYLDISDTTKGYVTAGSPADATLKPGENGVVSLGDGGLATLTFRGILSDGPGFDFAVFENGFGNYFLELAFVEVSSNGKDFFRFPSVSLTDTTSQVGSFDSLDATNIYNLAGKYRANYGTPFDLSELSGISGLNTDSITHIRVIDVVGAVDTAYASRDSQGNIVNDPWPTSFNTGGFDLDAVALINYMPTGLFSATESMEVEVYPNPAVDNVNLSWNANKKVHISLRDIQGRQWQKRIFNPGRNHCSLPLQNMPSGMYFIQFREGDKLLKTKKLIVH